MLEEEVTDAVDVSHLHIRAGQEIALLVTARDTHSDISLKTGELVSLRGYHTHHISLLALDAELSDGSCQVTLLVWRHG